MKTYGKWECWIKIKIRFEAHNSEFSADFIIVQMCARVILVQTITDASITFFCNLARTRSSELIFFLISKSAHVQSSFRPMAGGEAKCFHHKANFHRKWIYWLSIQSRLAESKLNVWLERKIPRWISIGKTGLDYDDYYYCYCYCYDKL